MNQTEKSLTVPYSHPKIDLQDFKKEDYVQLWQYFSDRADRLKDRLWTMATWLLGLNSTLLGFIFGIRKFRETAVFPAMPTFSLAETRQ